METAIQDFNIPLVRQPTIERRRLLEQLEFVVQHKVTLIAAPPGYGKTTLVAQYAHQSPCPIAWHLLEERERDVPNLHEHCLSALAAFLPAATALQSPKGASPPELALWVTDQLRQSTRREMIYALDDIHHVIGSPGAESWLRTFLAHLPGWCHLILIGRALPVLPLTEMIARREVLAIGQEQLRFTFDEIGQLAHQAGQMLSAVEIQQMVSRLDGWAAGTILALHPIPIELQTSLFSKNMGPEALFNGLADIMLDAQPASLQEFLLASSTLSQMSPALCQEALELTDCISYFTLALNRNLFISQVSGGLVYHNLFRSFLQQRLQDQNPQLYTRLHTQAGLWFDAHNRPDEAFDHYLAAHLQENAAIVADRAAQAYWSQGKAETVLYWRSQLGADAFKAPHLTQTCGMIHMDHYEYEHSRADLAEAEKGFQAQSDKTGLLQVILLQATIDNFRGEYHRAIQQALPIKDLPSLPPNLIGFALSTLGTAHLHLGELKTALYYLEAALPHWRVSVDAYTLSQLLLTIEVAYLRLGRFEDATACIFEVVSIRRALGSRAGFVMALNNLGYHYHLLGQYQEALATFKEGLLVSSRIPERRAESYLLWSFGDLQRDQGAFREADAFYQQSLQQTGNSEPPLRCGLLTSLSTLRRWEGKLDEAETCALEASTLAEKHQLPLEILKARMALCAIHIEREGVSMLSEMESVATELARQQNQTRLAQALGLCAYGALMSSDTSAAQRYLKHALETVNHPANLQPLIAEIVHLPVLKAHVLQDSQQYKNILKGLRDLEACLVQMPAKEPVSKSLESVPTLSLRVWTLGQERVERDGKPVPVSAWQAASARELFCYLLLKGATSREQIGLEFWPESSDQQIRRKFHTTLHRVRNAVGTNVILFADEMYYINPDVDIWCDAHEFEALVQQARLSSPLAAHTEVLWRRAVDLYDGDLLGAFYTDWIISQREVLHHEFLETLIALGNCARVRGNIQEAITFLKRAIAIDAFREDAHRVLFLCYAQLGERTVIQRLLTDLTQLLQKEVGVRPSAETLTLAQTLLG